jgi:hypothetical protein
MRGPQEFALLVAFVVWGSLGGCWLPADNAFGVRGMVKLRDGSTPSICKLRLYLSSNKRLLEEREIPPSFDEGFVIAPRERNYYMELQCAGTVTHTTQTLKLGNTKWLLRPVELGTIVLEKRPWKEEDQQHHPKPSP